MGRRKRERERLAVATNAAATAMFGVRGGYGVLTGPEYEAAKVIAARVLDHVDRYDRASR